MKKTCSIGLIAIGALFSAACTPGGTGCQIVTNVLPATATADHTLTAPGNQVQFSTSSSVTGNSCPAAPDTLGNWTTSDAVTTTISNQPGSAGLATCVNATPGPATIRYTGTVRGQGFTSAQLTCK